VVPFGDTQPLVAVVVLAPSAGAGPWSGVPGLGGTCRGLPARVGRSNSVAGPGELAEGRLPVWGSAEPAVRIWGRVVGPIRVGRPAPPATAIRHRLAAPPATVVRHSWGPGPAAYRAVELPSPTAGQTDCRRAVGPWTRSGSKNTVPNPPSRSTRVRARARHPALRTHEGHPGAVR
jgi:hypothetical protein